MGYRGRSGFDYGQIRRAQRFHARRSNRAKRIDESLRAPIAKSAEQWMSQPNRFDLPDVDTPTTKSQEEKDAELRRQLERFEANHPPSSLRQIRANLARHKLYGTTH